MPAKKMISDSILTSISDAIRTKLGTSSKYKPKNMASAILSIPTSGITPTGNINITTMNSTDVTNYATAKVVDADLVEGNIKSGVNILGVTGNYTGENLPKFDLFTALSTGVFPQEIWEISEETEYPCDCSDDLKELNIVSERRTDGSVYSYYELDLSSTRICVWEEDGVNLCWVQSVGNNLVFRIPVDFEITRADDVYKYWVDLEELEYMDIDTTDATATAEDIVAGKTAYVNSKKITGIHVEPTFTTEEKTVTPTESLQTITPTSADGLSKVTVNAISSTYVGSGVTRQGAKTVTPTKSSQTAVASGVYTTGAISVAAIPSNYVDVSGSTNVSAGNLLTGTKAYNSSGTLVTGNMANNGANDVTISSKSGATIPSGYYNGSGKAVIDSTSSTNLVEGNIKKGISILGITGTFEGSGGSSNIKSGSASLTTSSSTTNIKITDTSTIGFTPKAFFVWADTNQTSRYYVNSSYFITQGSGYRRSTLYRGSSSDSVLNATTTWTTSTNGYLYFNSNTVYFRNTSSYRVATGTYRWIALTW